MLSFAASFFSRIKFIFLLKKSERYLESTTDFESVTFLYGSFEALSSNPDWKRVPKLSTSALKTANLSIPLDFFTRFLNSIRFSSLAIIL